MKNTSIVLTEQQFETAARKAKVSPAFAEGARRVFVDGVPAVDVFDRTAEGAEVQYQALARIYRQAVPPTKPGQYTEADVDLVSKHFRFMKYWTLLALKMVLVEGYRAVEGAELVGIRKQQMSASIRSFEEKALQLGLSIPEGMEQVHCLLPVDYAKQVRELEAAVSHNQVTKRPQKRPVFAVLNTTDAEKVEAFIRDLDRAHPQTR